MNALHKLLNPKIIMLTNDSANSIKGRVVFNGQEWAAKPSKTQADATTHDNKESLMADELKALIEAAKAVRDSLQEYEQDEQSSGEIFYCEMMSESVDLLSDAVKDYEESINEKQN